jgi:hypothetical protein
VVVLRVKRVRNADAVCLSLLETFRKHLDGHGITVLLRVRARMVALKGADDAAARLSRLA